MKKTTFTLCLILLSSLSFASQPCDEFSVRDKLKEEMKSQEGKTINGTEYLKVDKIRIHAMDNPEDTSRLVVVYRSREAIRFPSRLERGLIIKDNTGMYMIDKRSCKIIYGFSSHPFEM